MAMAKDRLARIVVSLRKIANGFPVPARFRHYKQRKGKHRQVQREDDVYATYFVERHRGDHDVCVSVVRFLTALCRVPAPPPLDGGRVSLVSFAGELRRCRRRCRVLPLTLAC